MVQPKTPGALNRKTRLTLLLAMTAILLVFLLSGIVAYLNTRTLHASAGMVSHTYEVLSVLDEVVSLAKDAETGQRGYLITGDDRYLNPYLTAVGRINERLDYLQLLTQDNPNQQARIPKLRSRVTTRLKYLEDNIALRKKEGFEAARNSIRTDRGKDAMDELRSQADVMRDDEQALLSRRLEEMSTAYRTAVGSGVLSCLVGVALSGAVTWLARWNLLARQRQEWLLSAETGLSATMIGEQNLNQLGHSSVKFLAEYLDAPAAAFYAKDGNHFRRVATYGVPSEGGAPDRFELGDGLLGQSARDARSFIIRDVPDGYLTVASALGRSKPKHLIVAPMVTDNAVIAVIEVGFFDSPEESITELFGRVSESVGTAVRSANYRAHLQNFLEETQRQAEELQAQGEELRVSNEELEEQSRALKESQSRLEQQQAELEQTNTQLEAQTQLLEQQRDDANRSRSALQVKARELEQASQYKSDFLANMSHELRTPLNSSLILAKLLADNPQGNLTEEQVKYAETIRSAGNDLLALINDILDLSKIEAGHMEIRPESVRLGQLLDDLGRVFRPMAEQKGLKFHTQILDHCPASIETDRQRLEQVLKNLLANAFKFTQQGEVELAIRKADDRNLAFAVRDTGIGIQRQQQEVIFEAFRQADGTTNRQYGGTGLGLSISRELSRLLGGEIRLVSEPGQGSTFTVIVPITYDPAAVRPRVAPTSTSTSASAPGLPASSELSFAVGHSPSSATRQPRVKISRRIEDDRESLTGRRRVILVVEDDEHFSKILFDLAHELDFQCVIANTAEEALAVAAQHLPSAVILDVGLPDHSGLAVLDRLKHDRRTRHIPVHVISAGDHAQAALSLGAVGYMLKPVKREELTDTLKKLETRLEQRMRRVLVVEDDPVQQESVRKLLQTQDVATVGASSAAECLERLKEGTFDCMVLDLSLPDASGYSLLETLSREDAYAFPPVIVYTGRELAADEEQRLRRYSKSIIIKGAKSPERLLDEVTLFLHQVESDLPPEQQRMLERARSRDAAIEGRRILVVEDDVRNIFALTSILEPRGAAIQIARNGKEALAALEKVQDKQQAIDLILMDVMMPEMDGLTALRKMRERTEWRRIPVIMLTAKAMKDDQEQCLAAGANDYMAKPLDVEKLLSLVRVWMPR